MSRLVEEPLEIAVVDYGMGNRRSVEKALEHVGARATVSGDPTQLRGAAGLVVPGVGAFPRAMENLRDSGLDELLIERVAAGIPVLGICLGMELAFEYSTEQGGSAGLGIIPGEVRALQAGSLKLPHIGWNEVHFSKAESPLVENLPSRCAFYHVHSFAPVPTQGARCAGHRRIRLAVRDRGRAGVLLRGAVPPGEVLRRRPAPAGQLHGHLRHGPGAGRQVNLYPAIDILGGSAVRLRKGDFDASKVYDEDPLSAARGWIQAGHGIST